MVALCMSMYTQGDVCNNLEVILNRSNVESGVCDRIKLHLTKKSENAFCEIKRD